MPENVNLDNFPVFKIVLFKEKNNVLSYFGPMKICCKKGILLIT